MRYILDPSGKTKLSAQQTYWDMPIGERLGKYKGMGAGNGFQEWIVPDTIWGLNVRPVGRIHDHDYGVGKTREDKEQADREFLLNLLILIDDGNKWLKWLRRRRAYKYYDGVTLLGDKAFFEGK